MPQDPLIVALTDYREQVQRGFHRFSRQYVMDLLQQTIGALMVRPDRTAGILQDTEWVRDPRTRGLTEGIPGYLDAGDTHVAGDTTVLQAVLDAINGTLDPSTQIADHPNVKFAQMKRLELLKHGRGRGR